ncbi:MULTISPECIES: pyridoxal phosphate-dependent aminotransferase [Methanosphaera]|uniref:Aminotransferase n=2 Tax=Methanosphaera stadtmanae TaxID=2317 RepID=Q2NHD0_METST|nr:MULTISPECIES: pyridoxal phosphate-dependent aminotransferase [Methanosphaera]ABC56773.1 putative aspartate aminotransferase [Methanosphaera stadtmanae DSM 3091]MEE0489388.1 pyridoxal phosphate-dependent aminotransferase [Methanosphaera stadtmanae]OEC87247.1 aspartate aminotransferase [Methanosphaera sp. A6]RAP03506.1 aspartate aminotransferase [Methanosphaera stadtmanae]RAP48262.1 MAG: aspartate aminotransferase [Methanosphaera sp. DEW79]
MVFKKKEKRVPSGFNTINEFFDYLYKKEDLIWMGQNTNHLQKDKGIEDALIAGAKKRDYCKYPPPEGFPELKELILKDLELDPNLFDVQVTASATESLYLAISTSLYHVTNTIASDPGYLIINNFCNRFGNHVKEVPIYNEECGYKLTPELIKENIDMETKLIVLIDPLNPIGTAYTKDEIKEIAEIAKENNIIVLHDITYKDFARDHTLVAKYAPEHTITIYSFSKIFGMAGLRIGAVISSPDLMRPIRASVINDLGTNSLAQEAGIAGLHSKSSWIEDIKETCFKNQELIKEAVDETPGAFLPVYPSDANMMVIDISQTGVKPEDLSEYLLEEKNIFVREGNYTSKRFGDRYIRVSYSIPTSEVMEFRNEFKNAILTLQRKNKK